VCVAVGNSTPANGIPGLTLLERWNGTTWSIQPLTYPHRIQIGSFTGVSCASKRTCMVVGGGGTPDNDQRPLASRWNRGRWAIDRPAVSGSTWDSYLAGVSCPSAGFCFAVGGYYANGLIERTLVERWNGKRWSIFRSPNPTGSTAANLGAVSCRSTSVCTAVGSYRDGEGDQLPVAERWNGTRWSIQRPAAPPGTNQVVLNGLGGATVVLSAVSCPSRSVCVAAGSYSLDGSGFLAVPLIERWEAHK
jgi:hypothetical protein